jgi:hypothetical protein
LFELLMPGQEQQASDFYALIKANTDSGSLDNLNVTYLQALLAAGIRKPFWMTILSFFLLLDRAGTTAASQADLRHLRSGCTWRRKQVR